MSLTPKSDSKSFPLIFFYHLVKKFLLGIWSFSLLAYLLFLGYLFNDCLGLYLFGYAITPLILMGGFVLRWVMVTHGLNLNQNDVRNVEFVP